MRHVIAALIGCCVLTACEEAVNPILESDRQFTVFGTLDMARDTQFVRVIPIRPSLVAPDNELDVSVSTIELSSQSRISWRDSVHTFADGRIGHIFWAPLRLRAAQTYRLEVSPPDSDVITSAETTVPTQPDSEVESPRLEWVLTTRLVARQRVLWRGLDSAPYEIEQWYRFLSLADFAYKDFKLSYAPISRPFAGSTEVWEMDKDLLQDRDSLARHVPFGGSLRLAGVAVRITVLDDNFVPPGNDFDPEVLAQPGTLSNVENGFGLLASIGRFSVEWVLPDTAAVQLGYTPVGDHSVPHPVWSDPPGSFAEVHAR